MKCPVDNTELAMMERQNVEIDYCPQCRGVWLDRGELDKIIERSEQPAATQMPPVPPVPPQPQQPYPNQYEQGYGGGYHGNKYGGYGKHGRRKSFLGELFD